MKNIADVLDIKTTTFKIDETFEKTNLKSFILKYLEIENISFSSSDKILINNMYLSQQYQVFIVNKNHHNMINEVLSCFYSDKKSKTNDLFITKDFMCVYVDGEFYFYQKLNYELENDDLKKYIYKKLDINIENIYKIDIEKLEALKKEFKNKKELNFELVDINKQNNYSFHIYGIYLLVLFFSSYLYLNYEQNQINTLALENQVYQKEKISLENKEHSFPSIYSAYVQFKNTSDTYELKIEHLELKLDNFIFSVKSKSKDNLYSFLDEYKQRLESNVINISSNNEFFLSGNIKINK